MDTTGKLVILIRCSMVIMACRTHKCNNSKDTMGMLAAVLALVQAINNSNNNNSSRWTCMGNISRATLNSATDAATNYCLRVAACANIEDNMHAYALHTNLVETLCVTLVALSLQFVKMLFGAVLLSIVAYK